MIQITFSFQNIPRTKRVFELPALCDELQRGVFPLGCVSEHHCVSITKSLKIKGLGVKPESYKCATDTIPATNKLNTLCSHQVKLQLKM